MTSRTVTTMEELKRAKEEKVEKIIVEGKLADNLVKSKKIATLSAASLTALTAAIATAAASIAAAPVTGGISTIAAPVSLAVIAPIATSTGLSATTIAFLVSIGTGGVAVIVALLKGYTIEADLKNSRVTLYRK